MSKILTDEEVREEIHKLTKNPDVKLARAEQRAKYRERQRLYNLRNLEKRGAELRKQGYTVEDFYSIEQETEPDIPLMPIPDD